MTAACQQRKAFAFMVYEAKVQRLPAHVLKATLPVATFNFLWEIILQTRGALK